MNTQRRQFFKALGLTALVSVFGFQALAQRKKKSEQSKSATKEIPLIDPSEPQAKALNYQHEHSKVPANLQVERQGVAFKKQFCNNCMLYTKEGERGGKEVGKCQIIPGKVVRGDGWCNSWSKKA